MGLFIIPLTSLLGAALAALIASTSLLFLRRSGRRRFPLAFLNPPSSISIHSRGGGGNRTLEPSGEYVFFEITPEQREALRQVGKDDDGEERKDLKDIFDRDLAQRMREVFEREGVIVVRGLLDDKYLNRAVSAGNEIVAQSLKASSVRSPNASFTSLQFGPVFTSEALRDVALNSAIPKLIAGILLDLDDDNKNRGNGQHSTTTRSHSETSTLRVLKDAFFAKGSTDGTSCGWHVDDFAFWPTSAHQRPGVNAWIALDDFPPQFGGGLAVSLRSHHAPWREEAYRTIGGTPTFPPEGHRTAEGIFGNSLSTTCNMEKGNPDLAAVIDKTRTVFDMKRGDVLFHTRWIFHRSVPMTEEGARHFAAVNSEKADKKDEEEARNDSLAVVKRYSIRYELGTARLLRGYNLEPSLLCNPDNEGRSLDEVCSCNSSSLSLSAVEPWYPRCWPSVDRNEMMRLHDIVTEKLPVAQKLRMERAKEVMPYFQSK